VPPVVPKLRTVAILLLLAIVLLLAIACYAPLAPSDLEPASTRAGTGSTTTPRTAVAATADSETDPQQDALQPKQRTEIDVRFEHLSLEQGLSQSVVTSMLRDSRGFMWFGTQDGLNRYDGYEFVVYKHDPADPSSLSESYIAALHEDASGALWIGTYGGGLDRLEPGTYGGQSARFTHFRNDPEDPNSLSNNIVQVLHEDEEGVLWIGTEGGGVNKLVLPYGEGGTGAGEDLLPETAQFVRYEHDPKDPDSLSHNNVQAIHRAGDGLLWVGTNGGGLNSLDVETGHFRRYQHDPDDPDSLSHNIVQAIYEDREGALWIGTNGGGLDRLDREGEPDADVARFVHHKNDPLDGDSLSHDQVWAIQEDREGVLWVGTFGGGLDRVVLPEQATTEGAGRGHVRFEHHRNDPNDPASLGSNQIWSLYEDPLGVVWVGTFGGGANRFDPDKAKFTHYRARPDDPDSLSENVVWSILEDREGILWVGTSGGGLHGIDRDGGPGSTEGRPVRFRHDPADPHSLSDDVVWSILEDHDGQLWVGTSSGLDRLVPGKAGSSGSTGVSGLEDAQFVSYPTLPVFTIEQDRDGAIWIGTWGGGLGRLDPETEKLVFYQNDPEDASSLSDDTVVSILQDRDGAIWAGTFDGGLNKLPWSEIQRLAGEGVDPEAAQFTRYQYDADDPQSISHNMVLALHQDRGGTLWIATGGGGLNRLVPAESAATEGSDPPRETFVAYREKDGLPNDTVYGILEDDVPPGEGGPNLWLSTNRGIAKFNPGSGTFRNYGVGDGLQSNEFNQGAYHKSRRGEMFFGGVNGFNAFYPELVRDNPHVPPIALTSLTQGGEHANLGTTVDGATAVTLKWPRNFFEFEFAALDYAQPEKNQYAYRLEGFDPGWIETGTRHFGQYTNLPGGTYTLRLRGSNNDGVWNEEGLSVQVAVVPPFWATWWFRGGLVMVLLASAIAGYRLRVRSIEAHSRDLETQVADRTRDLAALNAVTAVVSRSLDLQEILDDALDMTLEVAGIEAGGVYLLDQKTGLLTIATFRGFSPGFVDQIDGLHVGEGFSGHVVETGQPLVVNDVSTDERLTRAVAREEGFHSLASVPLSSKGKVLGTLFAMTRDYRAFNEQEVQSLCSIGRQIGVALENARLFEAEQKRAEQFRLMGKVGSRITSILAVDELVHQVTRLIQETLGYHRVSIGLVEGDDLVFKGAAGPGLERLAQNLRLKVGSEGVTGWVASTGEPLLVADVSKDARFVPTTVMPPSQSELAVPLITKNTVIGVLNVESLDLDAFDESDLMVLQSLAHQTTVAIENAHLYEAASSRLAQLAALQETSGAVAGTLDLAELLELIIEQATTLLQADGGLINLVDWDHHEDEVAAASGSAAPLLGRRASLDGSLSGWVALHNEPLISNQIPDDSRVNRDALLWIATGAIQSAAVAPLTIKEQVAGTLVVMGEQEGKKEFSRSELDLLVAFANQAATALENAQLLEAERQRADELEALRTTMADITAELELPALLQAIVERAAGLLDATGGELGLYDAASQELRIVVSYNLGEDYVGTRHMPGEGAMGRVTETGESLIIEDYQTWEGGLAQYPHVHATLAAPLKVGGRLVGAFTTVTTDPERRFTPADLHLLNLFAQQAAIAIENARLYEQAQQLAVVEERQRLARDLHDSVTQALYGMTLYSEAAAGQLSLGHTERVAEHLQMLQETAHEALAEMRLLVYELRPPVLEEEGLVAALQARLQAVEGRAGLSTEFKAEGEYPLPPAIEEGLYRIAQEALNNALKHANARSVRVHLAHHPSEGIVSLGVVDDGVGFDPATARARGGVGLSAMEERAEEMGGRLSVGSASGRGTKVLVEVSL
jgi:GAF domain-containing protein/ligand-binding sensor domain-containing protein